jgi:NADH:ubiquinone oxidoreductase subunit 6 (subunit J)/NADH:ubiquinone oxidoreductase subunit 3 (subunit A)
MSTLKSLLPLFAVIAGIFVITTKNAIISVFNLIVLYILVAFYLIYIGVTFLGISYIIIYIGAIAILFLFIIMMIDVEVVEKRNNNYLPLLFVLFSGFLFILNGILSFMGIAKAKNVLHNHYHDSTQINSKEWEVQSKDKYNKNKNNELFLFAIAPITIEDNTLHNVEEINFTDIISNNIGNYNNDINYKNLMSIETSIETNHILPIKDIISRPKGGDLLLITPNWDSISTRITQIAALGDVLYTALSAYIYVASVIFLLSMVAVIILTSDINQEVKVINIGKNKESNLIVLPYVLSKVLLLLLWGIKRLWGIFKDSLCYLYKNTNSIINKEKGFIWYLLKNNKKKKDLMEKYMFLPYLIQRDNQEEIYSEGILGNLIYYIIANIIIAFLLLGINSLLSLSIKYLEKGGGFECGFTSFFQTRERYNIIFYRVSLLFLVFDLEIILIFPYTALYQKTQNMNKNNVLAFLYILVVGFVFELKAGALNIVKKAHPTELNIQI